MTNPKQQRFNELEQRVAEASAGIRYGAVEITIHDGRVAQIERREKPRPIEPSSRSSGGDAR